MSKIFNSRIFFVLVSITIIVFVFLVSIWLAKRNYQQELDKINLQHTSELTIVKNIILTDLNNKIQDTLFIRDLFELENNDVDNTNSLKTIAKDFQIFSLQSKSYDQIRFLDDLGQEKVRVNYALINPEIVAEEKLQNKKGRYYFDDTIKLNRNDVFISPFDLNIEQNMIEGPSEISKSQGINDNIWRESFNGHVKPMIRFATTTQNIDEKTNGIVILNYFGQRILKNIDELSRNSANPIFVVNKEGYWLISNDKNNEWGFMYEDKKAETIQKYYPDAWKEILEKTQGSLQTKDGLFIFDTVKISTDGKNDLKVISFIDQKSLNTIANLHNNEMARFSISIVILYLIFSFVYLNIKSKKIKAEEENIKIESILQTQNKELQTTRSKLEETLASQVNYTKDLEKSLKETEQKTKELEEVNKLMVNRELKMIELKNELDKLKKSK